MCNAKDLMLVEDGVGLNFNSPTTYKGLKSWIV